MVVSFFGKGGDKQCAEKKHEQYIHAWEFSSHFFIVLFSSSDGGTIWVPKVSIYTIMDSTIN